MIDAPKNLVLQHHLAVLEIRVLDLVENPKQTPEKDSLKTLRISKSSQKDVFQQRWLQIFLLNYNHYFYSHVFEFRQVVFLQGSKTFHFFKTNCLSI